MVDIVRKVAEPNDGDWARTPMQVRRTPYPEGAILEVRKVIKRNGRVYVGTVVLTEDELRALARDFC